MNWLNKMQDKWTAIGLFFILLGVWIATRDTQIFGFVSIIFGVIVAFFKAHIGGEPPKE